MRPADLVCELREGRPGIEATADRHDVRVRPEGAGELGLGPAVHQAREDELGLSGETRDEGVQAGFEEHRHRDAQIVGCGSNGRLDVVAEHEREAVQPHSLVGPRAGRREARHGHLELALPPRTRGGGVLPAVVRELPAPGGVIGVLERIAVVGDRGEQGTELAQQEDHRRSVERRRRSGQDEQPAGVGRLHEHGAQNRASLHVDRVRFPVQDRGERRVRSLLRGRPGRRQVVVDDLPGNPQPRGAGEGRPKNLVPRDDPLEGCAQLCLAHRPGQARDHLRRRRRPLEEQEVLLLRRENETWDVLSLVSHSPPRPRVTPFTPPEARLDVRCECRGSLEVAFRGAPTLSPDRT